MNRIKNNIIPLVFIALTSAAIIFLVQPLETTQWAEEQRTAFANETTSDAEIDLPTVVLALGVFMKVALLMGIGVVITALGYKLNPFFRRLLRKTV